MSKCEETLQKSYFCFFASAKQFRLSLMRWTFWWCCEVSSAVFSRPSVPVRDGQATLNQHFYAMEAETSLTACKLGPL